MYITEYIEKRDLVRNLINLANSDPIERIKREDGLPCDEIGYDEDGKLTKLVIINDERKISVFNLITLSPEDVENDPELKAVYENYMNMVTIEPVVFDDITKMAKRYKEAKEKSKRGSDVLSVQ